MAFSTYVLGEGQANTCLHGSQPAGAKQMSTFIPNSLYVRQAATTKIIR